MKQIKKLGRILIRDELTRKKLSVFLHNTKQLPYLHRDAPLNDFLNYNSVLTRTHFQSDEVYLNNSFYGIAPTIRRYASHSKSVKACIEHGVYFGSFVNPKEAAESGLPAVITFGEKRERHLTGTTNKPVYTIGPYISYADQLVSNEQLNRIREQLGRTLLVFPSHSHDEIVASFDQKELIGRILHLKKEGNFETALICLYWTDILAGRATMYEQAGMRVVTAGSRMDPTFLSRLRTLILISTHTASNSVGTHIGYSIALGRAHTILAQVVQHLEMRRNLDRAQETADDSVASRRAERQTLQDAFTDYSPETSTKQIALCSALWGLDRVRSPLQMAQILAECEQLYSETHPGQR